MRVVAVVPMKLNNRRLPQKNTKRFTNGEALCNYILSTLLQVDIIDDIFVYCSDSAVCDVLPAGVKFMRRSEVLDSDHTKMNEVLHCFAEDVAADIYLMTHTTAPFISKESIEKGLDAVMSGNYDSAFTAERMQDFFWQDGKPFNYDLENIPRTQDLPPMFKETSGFYIYRADVINKLKRRIGKNPYIVEVGRIEGIDIDEAEDFEIADAIYNFLICRNLKK